MTHLAAGKRFSLLCAMVHAGALVADAVHLSSRCRESSFQLPEHLLHADHHGRLDVVRHLR